MESNQILLGDSLQRLHDIPDEFVHCCVTSPPYWGLRDYGTASWEGGDPDCDHRQGRPGAGRADGIVDARAQRNRDGVGAMGGGCKKCGARRIDSQLGLESTPGEYVEKLVAVFREMRRTLRDDGTLWLNLGDSYNAYNGNRGRATGANKNRHEIQPSLPSGYGLTCKELKNKDLVGIPWRVAFALQADGWYLRSDIIWHKPNPMPESVTDRPTRAHEYMFLLSKSERYYYDAEAVKEPALHAGKIVALGEKSFSKGQAKGAGIKPSGNGTKSSYEVKEFRNRRSVWAIPTRPFKGAHFATFPPALAEPGILAGSPPGGVVLDPFMGAGTVGVVAKQHGRQYLGIELNPAYVEMARNRIDAQPSRAETALRP